MSSSITNPMSGEIYRYAAHQPFTLETTLQLLALAVLCAAIGFLLVERRLLERASGNIVALFSSSRSLPQPRLERQ